jgi:hypothetical protein
MTAQTTTPAAGFTRTDAPTERIGAARPTTGPAYEPAPRPGYDRPAYDRPAYDTPTYDTGADRRDPYAFEIDNIARAPRLETGERPQVDAARLWTGGIATAVVAALIGLVGTLVARVLEQLVPHAGTVVAGNQQTILLCTLAAIGALAATGIAHLLLASTPRPLAYLGWIVGLVTVIAVVLPFLSGRPLTTALTQAVIHLVIGIAIGSLVSGAAAAASREYRRARSL